MSDRHRPRYHFMPPANWMNDPNGLIQWQGTYHLFYQHNPAAAKWGQIHWGHATSSDLVYWKHEPIALAPTPGGPDQSGVWSGSAVNWEGQPTLVYTARDGEREAVCLALSDDRMQDWKKFPGNPVIPEPPQGLDLWGFRDPYVWNHHGQWMMVIGSGFRGEGGAVLLYSSPNMTDWTYLGPLLTGDNRQEEWAWTGEMWECPNFFHLTSAQGGGWLLMVSAMSIKPRSSLYTVCFTGDFDGKRFTPHRAARMDGGDLYFYAPQAFLDEWGRRIVFGWSREARSEESQLAAGWAGVMTLPRLLELDPDGLLLQRPVPEVEKLRGAAVKGGEMLLEPSEESVTPIQLGNIPGDSLEMEVVFDRKTGGAAEDSFGLLVRRSPDGEEQTEIRIRPSAAVLEVDTRRSSLSQDVDAKVFSIPLTSAHGDHLHMRVFIDCSIIEVFVDDTAVITARVYPSRSDSLGAAFFAHGSPARVARLRAWSMKSIYE
ncbi:MAG: glycoside hydrolase family 32 protein [Chloroflexi bacterium]|nr:glycoside hydrolase family 32 protein [Chloroflexota bacterium]